MGRPKECYFCARLVNAADGEHRKKINPSKHSSVKPLFWTFETSLSSQTLANWTARNVIAQRFAVVTQVFDNDSEKVTLLMVFKSSGELLWVHEITDAQADNVGTYFYVAIDNGGRVYLTWPKQPTPFRRTLTAFHADGSLLYEMEWPTAASQNEIWHPEATGFGANAILFANAAPFLGTRRIEARNAENPSTLIWSDSSMAGLYPLHYDPMHNWLTAINGKVFNAADGSVVSPSNGFWLGSGGGYMWRSVDPLNPSVSGYRVYSTSDLVNPILTVSTSIVAIGGIVGGVCSLTGQILIAATNPGEELWMILNPSGEVVSRFDYGWWDDAGTPNRIINTSWAGWNGDGTGVVIGPFNAQFPGSVPA
jgi:hypothetical protein